MKLTPLHGVGASAGALLTSSATLVCCVLPAILVALGAGATLAGLVSMFPQLIWMSENKGWIFGIAAAALFASGWFLFNARRLPCPTDPGLARTCARLRRVSGILYTVALAAYLLGILFAFVLPLIGSSSTS